MNTVATVAAVLVGVAFVVAGGSKLAAGRGWPVQAAGMGVPGWLAAAVPWAELAVGALLIVQLAEPWPAIASIVLLAAFSVLIARLLAAGRHPPCACFGAWSATPIGPVHLARNAALLAVAVVALL